MSFSPKHRNTNEGRIVKMRPFSQLCLKKNGIIPPGGLERSRKQYIMYCGARREAGILTYQQEE